ncbi:uncharacterized protein LOC114279110 [Camellia sinensis]|uniref:uncharacterized protein LOC114279110 n=1 Tax=Camellia sinensis TaxID=4442 RepID=UPI001035AEA4|nr:uncharacterized protein LOC114279110 [Camellia sinensis]
MKRMNSGRLSQWLQILVCVVILLKTEGFNVGITYVENAVAKGFVWMGVHRHTIMIRDLERELTVGWFILRQWHGSKFHGYSPAVVTGKPILSKHRLVCNWHYF